MAVRTESDKRSIDDLSAEEYLDSEKTVFDMDPEIVVLNHDDVNYDTLSEFKGTKRTLDYGLTGKDVKILNSKL